jgi:hypothetical protein
VVDTVREVPPFTEMALTGRALDGELAAVERKAVMRGPCDE